MKAVDPMGHPVEAASGLPKPIMKKLFNKVGLAVFAKRKGHVYCPEKFISKSLKLVGAEEIMPFGDLAKKVISHQKTLLDYDRLYTLYQAVTAMDHLPVQNGNIAEIGVYKGGGTYFIALLVEQFVKNKIKIFAFDTFEGHAEQDLEQRLDGPHTTDKFKDTSFEEVSNYLSVFDNVVVYKGRFQDQCTHIRNESFSFVHIDVDIYKPTIECLLFFSPRLHSGGIIVVDDYGYKTCAGAKQAVDEFMGRNHQFIKFHLTTGQCLLLKTC